MYDTETPAPRDERECSVDAWMRAAAYAAGTEPDDGYFVASEPDLEQIDFGQAVESKKRDSFVLGEALLCLGLIG